MVKDKELEIFPEKYEKLNNFLEVTCILQNNSCRWIEDELDELE